MFFFLSVINFVFIVLKWILNSFLLVGCCIPEVGIGVFAVLVKYHVVCRTNWAVGKGKGLVLFWFREVLIGIGKLEQKFDDIFLT